MSKANSKPLAVINLISTAIIFVTRTYLDILGVKPAARDPHNLMPSLSSFLFRVLRYLGHSELQNLESRSVSCSVHIVSATLRLLLCFAILRMRP